MASTTPLLFLLDGVLSQDEERVQEAVEEIAAVTQNFRPFAESPCASPAALYHVVDVLLAKHPEMAATRSHHDGSLPLHFAASLGNVQVASLIFSKFPAAAEAPNAKKKIPLHYAAREGRIDMVRFFLSAVPATASIPSEKQKLALHFAAGDGHADVCKALLQVYPRGASLPSAKGKLPLHFAARWGHLQIAHDLLQVAPDSVKALDWEGSLPLHDAAREGQYRMSRYLVERFPVGLQTANLRGEVPLFPAVRSGNVELVMLLVQAWPAGGKHILRHVSADDNITSWNADIMELLLRGATDNFTGCPLLEGHEPPTVRLAGDLHVSASVCPDSPGSRKGKRLKRSGSSMEEAPQQVKHRAVQLAEVPAQASLGPFFPSASAEAVASSEVASLPVRSKSPILGGATSKKKRKRSRGQGSDESYIGRVFLPLHASLEASASSHVVKHVLEQHPANVTEKDDKGMLPLHWAVQHSRQNDELVQLTLDSLLTEESAAEREVVKNRLPLHVAVAAQADVRLIKALLKANPKAGVDACQTEDRFHDMMPLHMATHYNCDLSTVFELLRVNPSIIVHPSNQ